MEEARSPNTQQPKASLSTGFGLGVSLCWILVEVSFLASPDLRTASRILLFGALAVLVGAAGQILSLPFFCVGSLIGGNRPRRSVFPAALAVVSLSLPLVSDLFLGDWVSQQPWQPAARYGSVILLFVVLLWGGGSAVQRIVRSARVRPLFGLLFAALAAASFYLDTHPFLVRKYPAAHDLLALSGLIAAGLGGSLLLPIRFRPVGAGHIVAGLAIVALLFFNVVETREGANRSTILRHGRLSARVFRPLLAAGNSNDAEVDENLLAALQRDRVLDAAELDRLLPGRKSRDVILVTIDTLRYDALSCLGGSAKTPQLDRFIGESLLFPNTWSQFPATRYAVNSFFAGLYPSSVDLDNEEDERVKQPRLAESLAQSGFDTRALTSFPESLFKLERAQLTRGFASFDNDEGETISKSARVVGKAVEVLNAEDGDARPRFLWVHLFDPHGPYHDRGGKVDGATPRERYDDEVEHIDACLKPFFDAVRAMPEAPLVIVHSDHGEEFQDHGGQGHNSNLYEEQIRVPLAFRLPGIKPGVRRHPVELIDLPATVREFAGLPRVSGDSGQSLLPILLDRPESEWPAPYALSQFRWPRFVHGDLDAVRDARWKLVHNRGLGLFELYDLDQDPGEQNNLAAAQPEVLGRMQVVLKTMREHAGSLPEVARSKESDRAVLARAVDGKLGEGERETVLQILREEEASDEGLVVGLLNSLDTGLRHAALFHVLGFQRQDGREILRRRLKSEPLEFAEETTIALAILGDETDLSLLPMISDSFGGPRRLVPLLGRYLAGDASLGPAIHQMLAQEGEDHDLETMAIRVLLHRQDIDFLPSLYSRSSRHITRAEQSAAIAKVVESFPFELASPFLRRFLRSPDQGMRARIRSLVSNRPEGKVWLEAAGEAEALAITARTLGAQGGETDRSMALFKKAIKLMADAGYLDYGLALEVSFYLNTWARRTDVITYLKPLLTHPDSAHAKARAIIRSLLTVAETYGNHFLGKIELLPQQKPRKNETGKTPLLVRVTLEEKSAAMVGGYGPETEYLGAVLLGKRGERLSEPATWLLPNVGVLPSQSLILAAPVNLPATAGSTFTLGIRLGRADLDLVKPLAVEVER